MVDNDNDNDNIGENADDDVDSIYCNEEANREQVFFYRY